MSADERARVRGEAVLMASRLFAKYPAHTDEIQQGFEDAYHRFQQDDRGNDDGRVAF